jgi:hypothetical protein
MMGIPAEERNKLCHTVCYSNLAVENYNPKSESCQVCKQMKALEEVIAVAVAAEGKRIANLLLTKFSCNCSEEVGDYVGHISKQNRCIRMNDVATLEEIIENLKG